MRKVQGASGTPDTLSMAMNGHVFDATSLPYGLGIVRSIPLCATRRLETISTRPLKGAYFAEILSRSEYRARARLRIHPWPCFDDLAERQ